MIIFYSFYLIVGQKEVGSNITKNWGLRMVNMINMTWKFWHMRVREQPLKPADTFSKLKIVDLKSIIEF